MEPFIVEGHFSLSFPVWVIGEHIDELGHMDKQYALGDEPESAVLVYTKYELAKSAARESVPANPEKPVSSPLIERDGRLTKITEPLLFLGLLYLLKEMGTPRVYFDYASESEPGYSIGIGTVRDAIAKKAVLVSDPVE